MIISCPTCKLRGENKNLAELTSDGLKIIRSIDEEVDGQVDYTLIRATEFDLICGNCLSVVLYKRPQVTIMAPQVDITLAWGTIKTYYENYY